MVSLIFTCFHASTTLPMETHPARALELIADSSADNQMRDSLRDTRTYIFLAISIRNCIAGGELLSIGRRVDAFSIIARPHRAYTAKMRRFGFRTRSEPIKDSRYSIRLSYEIRSQRFNQYRGGSSLQRWSKVLHAFQLQRYARRLRANRVSALW